MPCEYFLLIRRQWRPCLLAIDDGLSLAGQHSGRVQNQCKLNNALRSLVQVIKAWGLWVIFPGSHEKFKLKFTSVLCKFCLGIWSIKQMSKSVK